MICFLTKLKDEEIRKQAGAMRKSRPYDKMSEEEKDEVREATFKTIKDELKSHYPNERIFLIGKETHAKR